MIPQLSILLPVRNEGANLRIMLKVLSALVDVPYEVVVVHDDPQDDAVELAGTANVRIVHNTLGRGAVNAVRAGVAAAAAEVVVIFAADELGPVFVLPDMLALIREGCDMVSCTRYAHGGRRYGGSAIGHALSWTANRLYRSVTGCAFSDLTTGIKMFRRPVWERLELESRPIGWAFAFEMAIKAQMAGLVLGEVPIVSIDRLFGGVSSFRLGPWTAEYLRWFLWGLRQSGRMPRGRVRVRRPFVGGSGGAVAAVKGTAP